MEIETIGDLAAPFRDYGNLGRGMKGREDGGTNRALGMEKR